MRVEGLDLLPDDVIRSIDGVPVATVFLHEFLRERAAEQESGVVLFGVDRGGELFDVEVPAEYFGRRFKIGLVGVEAEN